MADTDPLADTSSNSSGAPPPAGLDIGAALGPVSGRLADIAKERSADTGKTAFDIGANLDRDMQRVNAWQQQTEATGITAANYPKWDAEKEHDKFHHDPVEAFGSLGSAFGFLAAAFTHAPMENALNASAAAINALKNGDDEGYERAHTAYKDNLDLALKRHELMRSEYQDAVTLMKTNLEAGQIKLKVAAARYQDQKVAALAENGLDEDLYKLLDSRNKTAEGLIQVRTVITRDSQQDALWKNAMKTSEQIQDPQQKAAFQYTWFQTLYGEHKDPAEQQAAIALLGKAAQEGRAPTTEEWTKLKRDLSPYSARVSTDGQLMSMLEEQLGRKPTSEEFIDAKRRLSGVEDRARAADKRNDITESRLTEDTRHRQALEDIASRRGDQTDARNAEIERHNRETEKLKAQGPIGNQNLTIQRQNAKAADEYAKKLRDTTDLDEDQIQTKRAEHYAQLQAKSSAPSGNRLDDMQRRSDQIKYAVEDTDKALNLLKKHGFITGIGGKVLRPGESIASAMGNNSSDWHEFESLITQIKQREARIALDAQGRPLASEGGYTDKIVRGLNYGDTRKITADRLMNLRKDLEEYRADTKKRMTPGSTAAPADTPKPDGGSGDTPAWKRAPLVGGEKRSDIDPSEQAA